MTRLAALLPAAAALLISACAPTQREASPESAPAPLHERILTLDTHLDTPVHFDRPGWSIMDRHDFASDLSHVDVPRMREGGLDGGFFVTFTNQGPLTDAGFAEAWGFANRRLAAIHRVASEHPDAIAIATTAAEARAIARSGKRIMLLSVENSYPLGEDLSRLSTWYAQGVRMAGPVHNGGNQLGDSASGGTARWGGLSPLGRQWVAEMNRLGMIIDASHSSDAALRRMLSLSRTPVILSHSGFKAIYDHPRNISDDLAREVAAHGGVIHINSVFLSRFNNSAARAPLYDRFEHMAEMTPEQQRELAAQWAALDQHERVNEGDFALYMRALLHCLEVVGADHCGIGADWDGGGGLAGMEDITALPRITQALKDAGYSDADIAKLWGGNVLRLLDAAEREARREASAR